ncbi:MAG: outer membrane beta-barrel protein [Chitinophagaceae bacterium]
MKKLLLAAALFIISFACYSQKGKNQVGVGADIGIPTGDLGTLANVGFGGYVKLLYGVGNAGQLTFTSGYSIFKVKDEFRDAAGVDKLNYRILPLLLGYRHNLNGFYIEPQLGYSVHSAKATVGSVSATNSDGAFTWGGGIGTAVKSGFDFGVRYLSATKDGDAVSWVSIHVGYNFSLKRK